MTGRPHVGSGGRVGGVRLESCPAVGPTRAALHRVAAHVLGRRRHDVSGRFGLRATPGGFGTPAFGPDPEVVRVSGTWLVHEVGGAATRMAMPGACLRDLSRFVGADLAAPFSVGDGGPDIGDADAPLDIDGDEANAMAEWFALGWRVLDEVVGATAAATEAATIQLWPEHFDAATTVG